MREGSENTALLEAENIADAAGAVDAHFENVAAAADEFEEVEAATIDSSLVLAEDAVEFRESAVGNNDVGEKNNERDGKGGIDDGWRELCGEVGDVFVDVGDDHCGDAENEKAFEADAAV